MHTRQSSLYFCTVKIKNFKNIHDQENIKVGQFIENLYYQEVVRLGGVKGERNPRVLIGGQTTLQDLSFPYKLQ